MDELKNDRSEFVDRVVAYLWFVWYFLLGFRYKQSAKCFCGQAEFGPTNSCVQYLSMRMNTSVPRLVGRLLNLGLGLCGARMRRLIQDK